MIILIVNNYLPTLTKYVVILLLVIMAEAYCVKCRTKREIKNQQETTLKNGRPALKGTCPECGTNVFRIGKA